MSIREVVLAGLNFNSLLGLSRAFGKLGYSVSVIRTAVSANMGALKRIGTIPEAESKYVRSFKLIEVNNPELLVRTLLESKKEDKAILIPVDDLTAETIDRSYDLLSNYYYLPSVGGKQGEVVKLMDKAYQKKLAAAAGMRTAPSVSIEIRDGRYNIPENVSYPCFAKAEIPFRSRKEYMGMCEDKRALDQLLSQAAAFCDCTMIVEDYLPVDEEYCIVGLCNKSDVCIPDVIDEMVLGHGIHSGVTCYGKVLNPGLLNDFIQKLKPFLSKLDFQGFFTVDVIKSGGELYFCELNMRIGGSGIAIIGAGVDLAQMYAEMFEEKDHQSYDLACREITFASERPLLNDFMLKEITWKQYLEYLKKADYRFVYAEDDLKPYFHYLLLVLRSGLKRMIRNRRRSLNR